MNRVLAVRGQVLPAPPTPITLHARLRDGAEVAGQCRIMRTRPGRAGLDRRRREVARRRRCAAPRSRTPRSSCSGPGSLFTSLLPALLVPRHPRRDRWRRRRCVIYRLQRRDADRRDGGLRPGRPRRGACARTAPATCPDLVLANNRFDATSHRGWQAEPVAPSLATGRRQRPAADPRRRRRLPERPPPRPRAARGGDHQRLGARGRSSAPAGRGARGPDRLSRR